MRKTSDSHDPDGILAIDDEVAILDIIRITLEGEGYVVHTASTPSEGIKLYTQHRQSIGLVLLDFMMPGMSGDLVLGRLQQINPRVRAILLSGSYMPGENKKFENGLCGCMQKPFSLENLIRQVRTATAISS